MKNKIQIQGILLGLIIFETSQWVNQQEFQSEEEAIKALDIQAETYLEKNQQFKDHRIVYIEEKLFIQKKNLIDGKKNCEM